MGQHWLSKNHEVMVYGENLKANYKGDSKSHIIYFVKQIDNKPIKFSCETKKPTTAYRYGSLELKKRLTNPDKKNEFRILIEDALDLYISEKEKAVQAEALNIKTLGVVKRSVKFIREYFAGEYIEVFEDIKWPNRYDKFVHWYQQEYPGQVTFNLIKYLKSFTAFLHDQGMITRLPKIINRFAKKELLRSKKKKQTIFSDQDIEALLQVSKNKSMKDHLFILFGYEMAFRVSDCCELSWDRISFDEDDPFIAFEGDDKAQKFAKSPMPDSIKEALLEYKKTAPESPWVFPQAHNPTKPMDTQRFDFKELRGLAKVKHGTFHTLRHTRLTKDFGNPNLPDSMVMIMRRISYKTALEHYIHPNKDNRAQFRLHAYPKKDLK